MHGPLLSTISEYQSRYASYPGGGPPITAFLRMMAHHAGKVDGIFILQALAFIMMLSRGWAAPADGTGIAAALNLDPSPVGRAARRLAMFFPDLDVCALFGINPSDDEVLNIEVKTSMLASLTDPCSWGARIGETASGYLMLAPEDAAPGDIVCLFDHDNKFSVPRTTEDKTHDILIGPGFVAGLMEGELRHQLGFAEMRQRWFELRLDARFSCLRPEVLCQLGTRYRRMRCVRELRRDHQADKLKSPDTSQPLAVAFSAAICLFPDLPTLSGRFNGWGVGGSSRVSSSAARPVAGRHGDA